MCIHSSTGAVTYGQGELGLRPHAIDLMSTFSRVACRRSATPAKAKEHAQATAFPESQIRLAVAAQQHPALRVISCGQTFEAHERKPMFKESDRVRLPCVAVLHRSGWL